MIAPILVLATLVPVTLPDSLTSRGVKAFALEGYDLESPASIRQLTEELVVATQADPGSLAATCPTQDVALCADFHLDNNGLGGNGSATHGEATLRDLESLRQRGDSAEIIQSNLSLDRVIAGVYWPEGTGALRSFDYELTAAKNDGDGFETVTGYLVSKAAGTVHVVRYRLPL